MENLRDEFNKVDDEAASVDAYAASDPAECFALLSEYFFSAPNPSAEGFPLLYQYFRCFYRQDPLACLLRLQAESAPARNNSPHIA